MKPFLEFFPIVLFFVVYKLYDLFIATEVLMVVTVLQTVLYWFLYHKIEKMHWITLGLILVFGSATLYFRDEQFIKWKFSIIEWIFGTALLFSQFVGKKTFIEMMMGGAIELPVTIWKRMNLSWALLFISLGFINLYVMFNFSTDDWMNFKTFVVPGLMLVFMVVQMALIYKHIPSSEPKE